ncbi:putative Actin-binding FH2 protein, partial [Pseudoloma neurophilia]
QINTEQISTYQINTDQMNADQINTENMIQETSAAKPKKMAMRKAPAKKKLDPFIQKLNNLKFKPLLHLKQIKNTIAYEEISKMFTEQDFQVFLRDETSDSMVKPTEKQNIKANISILDIKKSNAIAIALHTQKRAILNTIDLIFNLELMDENFLNVLLRYWPDKNEIYHLNNLIQEEKEPFGESEQLFVIILRKNCLDAFHDAIVRSLLRLKLYDHSDIKNGTKISKKLNDFRTNITSDMKSISEDIKSGQSSKILRPTDMKLRSKFEQSLMDYVFLYDFLCQDKMLLYTLKCIKFITNVLTRQSCSINTLQDPEIRQLVIQKVLNLSENSLEKLEINEKVLNIKLKNYEMLQSELQEIFSLEQLIIKNENDPIFDTLNLLKTLQKEIADLNKKLDTLFGENITEIEIKIILDYYKEVHNHLHLEKDSKNFTFKKIQSKMK